MDNNLSDIWDRVAKVLKMQIDEAEYKAWISNLVPVDFDENYFIFEVDNDFIRDRIIKNHIEKINEAFKIVEPKVTQVDIRVNKITFVSNSTLSIVCSF